jgi:solute carrier family 25 aspartate/glutamate transporter 12/13
MSYHFVSNLFNIGYSNINLDSINNSFTSGLLAGTVGAFTVYPIDVVKTHMQNQNKSVNQLYKNGFDCWRKLWQEGRLRPFYRGCIPQLIGVAPEKAVKLFAYSSVVEKGENNFMTHFMGGLLAGTCQVAITNPYEIIKINLQMNNKINWQELLNLRKLYTGASACFLRDIPFSAIYFPTYWYLKEQQKLNIFLAGTFAGAPSAFLCTPADVIKTRMQTLRKGNSNVKLINTINSIYQNEGFGAFWKGGGWRVMRSSPQFGVTLMVYELLTNKE